MTSCLFFKVSLTRLYLDYHFSTLNHIFTTLLTVLPSLLTVLMR